MYFWNEAMQVEEPRHAMWVINERNYEIRRHADGWYCYRASTGGSSQAFSAEYDCMSGPHTLDEAQCIITAILRMEGFESE